MVPAITRRPGLLLWLLCLLLAPPLQAPPAALAATATLTLNLSPGASFDLRLSEGTQEVSVLIEGNTVPIGPQIARWRHPLLQDALAIPRSAGVTVVRMKLTRRAPVYGALDTAPSQLRLGLGAPVANRPGVASRKAVDFTPAGGARAPRSLDALEEITPAQARARAPRDAQIRTVQDALWLPNIRPDLSEAANPNSLALGPFALYALPLPPLPVSLSHWDPDFATPRSVRSDPEVARLWAFARDGDLVGAYLGSRATQTTDPDGAYAVDLRYLEAALLYVDPDLDTHGWALTSVERARFAYSSAPDHPLALQTRFLAARTYMDMGFYHEASQILTALIQGMPAGHPKARPVYLARGIAHFYRGKAEAASADLLVALALSKETERDEIILGLAAAQLKMGRGPTALALLSQMETRGSPSVKGEFFQVAKADALYRAGQLEAAEAAFHALIEANAGGEDLAPWLSLRLGECLLATGQMRQAIGHFAASPRVQALGTESRLLLEGLWSLRGAQLGLLRSQGEPFNPFVSVLEQLRMTHPYAPVGPEALFELGKYDFKGRDLDAMVENFKLLLRQSPDFPLRQQVIAMFWEAFQDALIERLGAGEDLEVLSLYERFVPVLDAERLGDQRIFYLVAERYLNLGLYDRAYKALSQTFFSRDPDPDLRDRSLLLLIQTHRLRGDLDEATNAIRYTRRRRASPMLKPWLDLEEGRILLAQGETQAGTERLRAFLSAKPQDPECVWVRLELGRSQLSIGQNSAAARSLRASIAQAESLAPDLAVPPTQEEDAEGVETGAQTPTDTEDSAPKPLPPEAPARELSDYVREPSPTPHIAAGHRIAVFLLPEALIAAKAPLEAGAAYRRAATLYPDAPDAAHALYAAATAFYKGGDTDTALTLWTQVAATEGSTWATLAQQMLTQLDWERRLVAPRN